MIPRLALLGLLLLPAATALWHSPTTGTLANRETTLFARSLLTAGGAALLAALLGTAWAALLAHRNLPGRGLVKLLALTPLLVPPYLWTLAWLRLGLPTGHPALVLGACLYPLVLAPTLHALERCPASLVDQARLCGNRPWSRVLLPLAAPYAAAGTVLVFLLALGEYGVPSLLQVDTWAVEIFALLNGYHDLPAAARAALPALGVGLAALALTAPWLRPLPQDGLAAVLDLPGRARVPAALLATAGLAVLALPLHALGREADRFPLALWQAGPDLLTSLGACALAAVGATAVAAWLAAPRRLLLAAPVLSLLAFPPALLDLGWATWGLPLAAGLAARALPLAFPLLLASYLAVPRSLDEAARLQRPMVQMHRPALRLAAALVFALALGDLTGGLLLTPPGSGTLATRLFQLQHSGQPDLVAALCLVQVGVSLSPFLAASALNALEEP